MTYAQLQTAVEAWTHRTDLATLLPTFVGHAEARLNRDLRVRQMEAEMAPTAISVDGEVGLHERRFFTAHRDQIWREIS